MRLNMRIHPLVDERHASSVAHEAEGRSVSDAGVHGDVPFDSQAEPEFRLCAKGTAVPANACDTDAVDHPESPAERFRRTVPVADSDIQHLVAVDEIRRCNR